MKNFVQRGESVTVSAPVGGVSSGQGFLLTTGVFVVAKQTATAGADVDVLLVGVVDFPKAAVAVNTGDLAYWDNTNKVVTNVSTSNTKIGLFVAAAGSTVPTGRVRLNGTF